MRELKEKFRQNERALVRIVADEAVILDLEDGQYYGLNPTATRVWQLLGEGKSVESICEALFVEFDVDRETLKIDVDLLLEELLCRGLLLTAAEDRAVRVPR